MMMMGESSILMVLNLASNAFYLLTLYETNIIVMTKNPRRDFIYSSAFDTDMRGQIFDSTVSN